MLDGSDLEDGSDDEYLDRDDEYSRLLKVGKQKEKRKI